MRKALYALPSAAAAVFATPALAQDYYGHPQAVPLVAGATVGTLAGVGAYNGWYAGWGAVGAALPATTLGAVAVGGVVGVGTVALVDAIIQPCRGFHALLGLNSGRCENGVYVGDRVVERAPRRVTERRVIR